MLRFNDPTFGFGNFLTDIGKDFTGERAGEQQRDAFRAQARAAEVEGARELRDERETQKLRTSRMMALAAARGRGADLLQTIARDVGESAIRQQRISSDTAARARGLRFQGRAAKAAGEPTIFDAVSVIGNLFTTGQQPARGSVGSFGTTPTQTPTTPAYRKASTGRLAGPV